MPYKYPDGLVDYVKENYMSMNNIELREKVNETFGTNLTLKAMCSLKKRHNLSGAPRVRVYTNTFPEYICEFIAENYKGTGHKAMTEKIKEKYGIEYTAQQIKSYYANHGFNSGLTGRWEKGKEAYNKGKKLPPEQCEKIKRTSFKPGHVPHNQVEVGTIIFTGQYYKIKTAEPNKWEFCHRLVYKEAYGEIPKGMIVSFLDGDVSNYTPENLILISQEENACMNINHMRSRSAEVTQSAAVWARLKMEIRKKRKEKNGPDKHI